MPLYLVEFVHTGQIGGCRGFSFRTMLLKLRMRGDGTFVLTGSVDPSLNGGLKPRQVRISWITAYDRCAAVRTCGDFVETPFPHSSQVIRAIVLMLLRCKMRV